MDNNWEVQAIVGFSWSSKALTRSILLNASGRIHCANGKIHELVFTLVLHWVVLLSYILTYLKNSSKNSIGLYKKLSLLFTIKSYFNTVVTFLWNTVQELIKNSVEVCHIGHVQLKVPFFQKVRFVFQISQSSKKIVPKNYPELEIWNSVNNVFKFQAQDSFLEYFFGRLGDLKNESHFLKKKPPLVHIYETI